MLLDMDKVDRVLERWQAGDDFDTLAYCIQDVLPETRESVVLVEAYHRKCKQLMIQFRLVKHIYKGVASER